MQRCSLNLAKRPIGLVVRPAADGCGYQTLVFSADEVRTLEGGSRGEPFRIGPQLVLGSGASLGGGAACALHKAGCAVFDPASGCVFFADGAAVMRLSPSNAVTLAAGSRKQPGNVDGVGEAARFGDIRALAADGRGAVYVAEPKVIRAIIPAEPAGESADAAQQASCTVTTLPVSAPAGDREWQHLAYDSAADMLLAATYRAVASVPLPGGGSGGGGAGQVRLLAGHWTECAMKDGDGDAARFTTIAGMLAGSDHRIHVADYGSLRRVDGHSTVRTVASDCFTYNYGYPQTHLAILPSGQLAAAVAPTASTGALEVIGGGFAPSSQLLALGAERADDELLKHLLAAGSGCGSAGADGADGGSASAGGLEAAPHGGKRRRVSSSGGGSDRSSTFGSVVTVRVGGTAFVAHLSLLAYHSDYFKKVFEGGFAESGTAEVELPDADPAAFGLLLTSMYRGVLGNVPSGLLRPAAELAGRLLMPAARSELAKRLLAACSPARVVSDLLWAEAHSMGELVVLLKAYFVSHAREVVAATPKGAMAALASTCPELTAELMVLTVEALHSHPVAAS